jgi:hypothetical protein
MQALQQLDGAALSAMMSAAGPIVSCVFIPGDTGVAHEVQLDMTPKLAAPKVQLGGSPTFAGTFESLDVVVMCLREPPAGTPTNPHALPRPMGGRAVVGPLLMIRMDENSEPQHFTLKEYEAYRANPPAPEAEAASSSSGAAAAAVASAVRKGDDDDDDDDDEEEENDEEDDEEEDDDDEEGDYMEHVVLRIAAIFKEKTGRDPTPEEVQSLLEKMQQGYEEGESEGGESEEEEEAAASAAAAAAPSAPADTIAASLDAASPEELTTLLRSKLAEAFRTAQGREPTEDEIEALLAQLSEDTELHDGLLAAGQRQEAGAEAAAEAAEAEAEAAAAAASPPAADPKKRKLSEKTPAPESNKAAKMADKVSPQSVAAVE